MTASLVPIRPYGPPVARPPLTGPHWFHGAYIADGQTSHWTIGDGLAWVSFKPIPRLGIVVRFGATTVPLDDVRGQFYGPVPMPVIVPDFDGNPTVTAPARDDPRRDLLEKIGEMSLIIYYLCQNTDQMKVDRNALLNELSWLDRQDKT